MQHSQRLRQFSACLLVFVLGGCFDHEARLSSAHDARDASIADGAGGAPDGAVMTEAGVPDAAVAEGGGADAEVCSEGYAPSDGACAPMLTSLTTFDVALSPALSVQETRYRAEVSMSVQTITLTLVALEGSTVTIAGEPLVSGAQWQSPILELGDNVITIVVSKAGYAARTYTLTVSRGYQDAYLKASNAEAEDRFGEGLAISGNTLVVGAITEDSDGTSPQDNRVVNSGAVYVFVRDGSTWIQQAYLKAAHPGENDWFGASVAISGDTLVVGAPFDDSNGTSETDESLFDSGAAYVFVRHAGIWSQEAYLKPNQPEESPGFALSVAIDNDTIVVGARNEGGTLFGDTGSNGAAYVFARSSGIWSQQARLTASNPGHGDCFGTVVDISRDTVVVGALWEDSDARVGNDPSNDDAHDSGAAYVFVRSDSVWSEQARLKASDSYAGHSFGCSVDLSGDSLAVGACGRAVLGLGDTHAGAYVFVREGSAWSEQACLKRDAGDYYGLFGSRVALAGDSLVVGALRDSSGATGINGDQSDRSASESGAAFLFERVGDSWLERAYVKASNTNASDAFGVNVAIENGVVAVAATGEGSDAIGINGDQANNDAPLSGAVYVFR